MKFEHLISHCAAALLMLCMLSVLCFGQPQEGFQNLFQSDAADATAENTAEEFNNTFSADSADDFYPEGDFSDVPGELNDVMTTHSDNQSFGENLTKNASPSVPAGVQSPIVNNSAGAIENLNFYDADIRKILEVFSKTFNYNIFVDESVTAKKITFFYSKNLKPLTVLEYILKTNSLMMKKVDNNIIVVYPKQKEREYYDDVKTKTFYLSNAAPDKVLQVIKGIDRDTKVFINEKLNAITVIDRPENLKTAARIIDSLDKRKPQILVDMKLVDVRREKLRDVGVSYHTSNTGGLSTIRFKQNLSDYGKEDVPKFYASTPDALFEMLERDSDTRILARPRIRLIDQEKAKIRIADVLPIKVTKTSAETGNEYNTTPEWKDVGIKFEVELKNVHLDSNATIRILTEVSSKTGERDGYPIISTQEAESMIRVRDNETIILGGLVNNTDEKTNEEVPFFSKLPLFGNAFKKKANQKSSREILIFISTKFIYDDVESNAQISKSDSKAMEFSKAFSM